MHEARFDAVAKTLGSPATRRLTLGALFAGALGVPVVPGTRARKSGKCQPKCGACEKCKKGACDKNNGKKRCKKGKCKPKADGIDCTVPNGGICQNGRCACPGGLTNCGGRCVDSRTDETACGPACTVCATNRVCQEGSCFPRSTCPAETTAFTFCVFPFPPGTPCGVGCSCGRSTEGNALCLADDDDFCAQASLRCTTTADCSAGRACVDVTGCCPGMDVTKGCLNPCAAPTT
jgi:hypothetical protein